MVVTDQAPDPARERHVRLGVAPRRVEIPVRRAEASAYCRDDAARDAKVGLEDVRRRIDRTPPWALPRSVSRCSDAPFGGR
jgi:hypothetical protein